jgi:hypothetical protein
MAHPNHSSPNAAFPPTGSERQKIEDPFAFISPVNVQKLRNLQEEFVVAEQYKAHPLNHEGREEAAKRAMASLDGSRRDYLHDMGVTEFDEHNQKNPDYDQYMQWVTKLSIDNMNDMEWLDGSVDANGERVASGREMAYDIHSLKVDEHRNSIGYRLGSNTSPDVTQPVQITPNVVPDPEQTQNVPIDPDAKITVSTEMINKIAKSFERDKDINYLDKKLDWVREQLAAIAVKGNTRSDDYLMTLRDWETCQAQYADLCEQREMAKDPNRSDDDFLRDATVFSLDQISRLDALVAEKRGKTLRGKFVNAFKNNKLTQMVMGGVVAGTAALAEGSAPTAVAIKAAMGATLGPKMIEGTNALVGNTYATEYDQDMVRSIISATAGNDRVKMDEVSQYLGERFTTSERKRRKKAGLKVVLGGAATVFALAGISYAMDGVSSHDFSGHDTVDGTPYPEGSASATRPDHGPFDIDTSGENGKQPEPPAPPETSKPPVQPEQPQPPVHPEIPPIFTPEVLTQGVNVPLEWGDGALAVGERLGLDADQQQRFLELLSERHDGSTYMGQDGVRLYFNEGALHLSPTDLLKIFNP